MVCAFDTLQFADGLKDAGTPVAQAEATARLLGDALAAVRADTRWIKGMLATQFAGMMALLIGTLWLLQRAAG